MHAQPEPACSSMVALVTLSCHVTPRSRRRPTSFPGFPTLALGGGKIAHFADTAAIFEFIVSNTYYRMLWGQIHIYLPPEHPIMDI